MNCNLNLGMIREILGEEDFMSRRRYQDPKIETRDDVQRPYYFVRVAIPKMTANGLTMKRVRHPLGFVDETTKKEAKARRGEVLDTINNGRAIVESQIRFRDIAKKFVDVRVPQLGAATQSKYALQIENHILPAFGNMKMCDIDKPAIEAWLTEKAQPTVVKGKQKEGLGWWSRVDLKGIMSGIFSAAKDWKLWSGDNPCHGVRIGKKSLVREKRILTAEKLRELLAALPDHVRLMVVIAFATGLRISEILGLKWQDINFESATLTVARRWHRGDVDVPKSEESKRTRQLGPLVEEFKRKYPGPHSSNKYIFAEYEGLPPDDRDINREILRPIAKRLGIYFNGFGFHTFRRQNISWRQTVGGSTPLEAQKMAGHAKVDMTMLYTITEAEREKEQVVRMLDRLMEVDGGKPQ